MNLGKAWWQIVWDSSCWFSIDYPCNWVVGHQKLWTCLSKIHVCGVVSHRYKAVVEMQSQKTRNDGLVRGKFLGSGVSHNVLCCRTRKVIEPHLQSSTIRSRKLECFRPTSSVDCQPHQNQPGCCSSDLLHVSCPNLQLKAESSTTPVTSEMLKSGNPHSTFTPPIHHRWT